MIPKLEALLERLKPVALLLLRLNLGILFVSTGWGKTHDLASITNYFTDLHIPLPGVNAVFVSYLELVGGALLVVGLATRFVAAPLAGTMVVAIMTAKAEDIHSLSDLASTDELTYMLVLVALVVFGAGMLSVDHFLRAKLRQSAPAGLPASR